LTDGAGAALAPVPVVPLLPALPLGAVAAPLPLAFWPVLVSLFVGVDWFAVVVVGAELAGAAWELPLLAVCGAGVGLAGGLEGGLCDGFGDGFGDGLAVVAVDAVASSKASNGVESSLWLVGWACAAGGGAADGAFGAILCILDTEKLPQAT
jgi:hypothetical protein